ncbi:MAG: hypothetical protein GF355_04910 [Candidatus Eisenbacteria bacterium]|nr:hypothetical protein [Candidatus Eisenbacteria bacterium]
MPKSQDAKSTIRRSLQEHESLRQDWSKLEELASQVRGTREELGRLLNELLGRLDSLIPHLENHFRCEETQGLHEEIVDVAPNLEPKVQRLLSEHSQLLQTAGELRGITQSLVDTTQCQQARLYDRITQLLAVFREHEAHERTLFLEALEGEGPGLA